MDAIVLTEHRKFDRDADYSGLAHEHGVVVLKASELDTRHGHFLVYGVTQGLQEALDFSNVSMDSFELMREARARGAVALPAHPGRSGIGLCEYIDRGVEFPSVSIVETLNGGGRKGENERAQVLADQRGYKGTGGSDAHLVSGIATCLTAFPLEIRREEELVEGLLAGDFFPVRLEDTAALSLPFMRPPFTKPPFMRPWNVHNL